MEAVGKIGNRPVQTGSGPIFYYEDVNEFVDKAVEEALKKEKEKGR